MGAPVRLPGYLALAAVATAYVTIVLGGYTSRIGAGLACPDWPLCHGQLIPDLSDPSVAAEYSHRLAALLTGVLTLATLVTVWWRHRDRRGLVAAATGSFGVLALQVVLGMLAITTFLAPVVVTAHLALATAFVVLMTATALLALLGPPAWKAREASPAPDRTP